MHLQSFPADRWPWAVRPDCRPSRARKSPSYGSPLGLPAFLILHCFQNLKKILFAKFRHFLWFLQNNFFRILKFTWTVQSLKIMQRYFPETNEWKIKYGDAEFGGQGLELPGWCGDREAWGEWVVEDVAVDAPSESSRCEGPQPFVANSFSMYSS